MTRPPRGVVAVALISGVLAGASRSLWLGRPGVLVFDEIYYASDAVDLLTYGVEGGRPVHPALGKWMLAAGIQLVGFEPWGWRLAPLIAGALTVSLTAMIGWRLTDELCAAILAAAMVLLDGISVVTGRLALLDGLVALWTTAALLLLADQVRRPLDIPHQRRSRWLLGAVLGLAVATKWSAALLIPVAVVTAVALDRYAPPSLRRRSAAQALVALVVLPIGVYAAAHAFELSERSPAEVVERQWDALEFHRRLEPSHPDTASALTWPLQSQPVALLSETCEPPAAAESLAGARCGGGDDREVHLLALGNPVVWLVGTVAVLACSALAVRGSREAAVVAAVAAAHWLPWIVGGRPGYTFYAAGLVPVLGAAVAVSLVRLPYRLARWWPVLVLMMLIVAVAWWPLWTGAPIEPGRVERLLPYEDWRP